MSEDAAYRVRMVEKHLANWADAKTVWLRDESPNRRDWCIEAWFDDGTGLMFNVTELSIQTHATINEDAT